MAAEPAPSGTASSAGYRWVVLAVFCLVNLAIQVLWIAYAPITSRAAEHFGVSEAMVGWLAMSFMAAFLVVSIPASWAIDHRGFRFGVGVGAVLMAVCGPLRGLAGHSYAWALACSVGLAVAQPFFLNAWTKLPALWFPPGERATAVGLVTLANLLGTGIGLVATPWLVEAVGFDQAHLLYGVLAAACSAAFLLLARERPAVAPGPPGEEVRALMVDGLRHALGLPSFLLYLAMTFVGMGVFNGVTTWIEPIIRPAGLGSEEAGILGGIMLGAGLVGAVAMASLSDRLRRRRPFLVVGFGLSAPAVLGLGLARTFPGLALASAALGFFLTSSLPVGMQYVAELTHPTPEGTSSGVVQLCGQCSVALVYAMEAIRGSDGGFGTSLALFAGLLVVAAVAATRLQEGRPAPVPVSPP